MVFGPVRRRKDALRLIRRAGPEVRSDFGKSIPRQILEILLLSLKGYSAADYYLLGLYKGLARAPRFMTQGQYNQIRRRLNHQVCGIIEFNKWVFGKYCESVGVPTPHCYGVFHKDIGFAEDLRPLRSFDDLWRLVSEIDQPLVFKPLAGDRGENVRIFNRVDRGARALIGANGSEITFEALHRQLDAESEPWLVQEKVDQHPVLAALHPSSVNTVRVITVRDDDGKITILAAALRIGLGAAEIDNTTGGGIAAAVDLAKGTCAAATSRLSIRAMARHPDTGAQIEGLALPYWSVVRDTALTAHMSLPFARSLGWDIAFGQRGPVVLEVNGSWYYNRIQMAGQSLWETAFGQSRAAQPIRPRSGR